MRSKYFSAASREGRVILMAAAAASSHQNANRAKHRHGWLDELLAGVACISSLRIRPRPASRSAWRSMLGGDAHHRYRKPVDYDSVGGVINADATL